MAVAADEFAAKHSQVSGGLAEHTAPFELTEQHPVTLDRHIEEVTLPDAKYLAELSRNDNSTEVIDLASNSLGALV
jgi:hypothetical protein